MNDSTSVTLRSGSGRDALNDELPPEHDGALIVAMSLVIHIQNQDIRRSRHEEDGCQPQTAEPQSATRLTAAC